MNPNPHEFEIQKLKVEIFNEKSLLNDLQVEHAKAMEDFQHEKKYVISLKLLSIVSQKNISVIKGKNKIKKLEQKLQDLQK